MGNLLHVLVLALIFLSSACSVKVKTSGDQTSLSSISSGADNNSGLPESAPNPDASTEANSEKFKFIAAANYSACATTDKERIICWGYNGAGVFGNGNQNLTLSLVP